MNDMTVVVFKGGAQTGKSTVAKGLAAGARATTVLVGTRSSRIEMVHVEFSTPLVEVVNAVLGRRPKTTQKLELELLRQLKATILPKLQFPTKLDTLSLKLDSVLGESNIRVGLKAWYDNLPKKFVMTELNKDANRIILSWLAVAVRSLSGNDAIFVAPILNELKQCYVRGVRYASVGDLRYPAEVRALRKVYPELIVVEIQSLRVKVDTDEANAKTGSIKADTIYHADFESEIASSRYARRTFWEDVRFGSIAPVYGPQFLGD